MAMISKNRETQSGFTLIEMMLALTIGLFILGAIIEIAINSVSSNKANNLTSELQLSGRYALDTIRRDVQHAGQSGLMPNSMMSYAKSSGFFSIAPGVAVTGDCAPGFAVELDQAVAGSDDSNPYAACISNYLQGDILVVRYADMQNSAIVPVASPTSPPAFAAANDIFFRSSYSVSTLFQNGGTAPYVLGSGAMQDQLLRTYVYYIGSYSTTPGDGIPALWRVKLAGGAMTPELVASGIENLQLQYGVVDASGNTQYLNASGINAWPSTTYPSWAQVKSVRVWLLARTDSKEGGNYSNQTAYQMGNVTYTPTAGVNDKFRRQLYVTTIDMRN
jgi:type IV pilus assembly protein PilW